MSTTAQPKVTLYRGWNDQGKYVWSPFVTKLEFRFRTSSLPYTCAAGSPLSAPKGKIPYVELSTAGQAPEILADSALILESLSNAGLVTNVNELLNPKDKGIDMAVKALLEDKLYFFHTHERWIKNYYIMRDHALWSIPYPIRVIVGLMAYRGNVRKMYDQGSGRFSEAEIKAFIKEIWTGISGMLAESKRNVDKGGCYWVLGGEEPTEADATVFGFIVSVLVCDAGPESRELLKTEFPIVVEYAEKIHHRYFPDYEIWK